MKHIAEIAIQGQAFLIIVGVAGHRLPDGVL